MRPSPQFRHSEGNSARSSFPPEVGTEDESDAAALEQDLDRRVEELLRHSVPVPDWIEQRAAEDRAKLMAMLRAQRHEAQG